MSETLENLKHRLGKLAYAVTQEKATERPFSSEFAEKWQESEYLCVVCEQRLFNSDHQFNAGCGWPSFDAPVETEAVAEHLDASLGHIRTEVVCKNCGAHLGHVFQDGPPQTTGLRYCINGAALKLIEK